MGLALDPTAGSTLAIKTHGSAYQIWLIVFLGLVAVLTGAFFWRELFPEYKVYQKTYLELEGLRGERPNFEMGIKQILYYEDEPGPETIDRCVSCHVAGQLPHFSPTKIARDINGQIRYDSEGIPVQVPNEEYVFNLPGAEELRYQEVEGLPVDMAKVLVMHPLLGAETRPFELHPSEQYGCTSCHSGNGRSVNAKRAHGPVFDEEYEIAEHHPVNPYLDVDEENDPQIASVFNYKPGYELLFQTTPLLPGALMEAKCAQCHQSEKGELEAVVATADIVSDRKGAQVERLRKAVEDEQQALVTYRAMLKDIEGKGLPETLASYTAMLADPALTATERDAYDQRVRFLKGGGRDEILAQIKEIDGLIPGTGSLGRKMMALQRAQANVKRLYNAKEPMVRLADETPRFTKILGSYERGRELFVSQACYGCHRVAGISRGGVGPELTEIGLSYPWYVKMSIVWPQGKLPGSAMPNFHLDHEEVEDLLAFLMAQTDETKALAAVHREQLLKAWDQGNPLPWEKPIAPSDIHNVAFGMEVFATEGCAACHRLRGFNGNVSYRAEDREWFYETFPSTITGQQLVDTLRREGNQIDQRLAYSGVQGTVLQGLDQQVVKSYYSPFKYAQRADSSLEWQDRTERVLTMFIQEYGLGRDIGPRLSWSGIWRNPQWLTGHFLNPTAYSPRSIMPVFPFDITKFYSLNNMLSSLGVENRNVLHRMWSEEGFNPEESYEILCSACHGTNKEGNGPISEWIYPIPKNLRNAHFLQGLTREQAIRSITEGVKGTPMPPWGESVTADQIPMLNEQQIVQMVDWLYSSLPATTVAGGGSAKWLYNEQDVAREVGAEEKEVVSAGDLFTDGMIREGLYTPVNIEAGERNFQINCAHCHGSEAAGNGTRSEAMSDAKPRMLTNLYWLQSQTDIELLQSIKFGVPGTAMVGLGDQTSALQRLQMVLFIRTLAQERDRRDQLQNALYQSFDETVLEIERCREGVYRQLATFKEEYQKAIDERESKLERVQAGRAAPMVAAAAYEQELKLMQKVARWEAVDDQLELLIKEVRFERGLYNAFGEQMIAQGVEDELFGEALKWMGLRADRYQLENGCVMLTSSPKETQPLGEQIVVNLTAQIDGLEEKRLIAAGRKKGTELEELTTQQRQFINLKTTFLTLMRESNQSQDKQEATFAAYEKGRKQL